MNDSRRRERQRTNSAAYRSRKKDDPAFKEKNRARCAKYHRDYRKKNPVGYRLRSIHGRCRKLGIPEAALDRVSRIILKKKTCDICKTDVEKAGHRKSLAIDHDHQTGKIRGLLCMHCNTALGLLKDDIGTFESAAAYLRKHAQSK